MEMLCLGFLIGAVTSIIFVGIGIVFGRGAEKKDDKAGNTTSDNRDSEVLLHRRSDDVPDVSLRNRDRNSVKRDSESMAEKAVMVLQNFRVGACGFETSVIDWMIEQFEKEEEYPLGRNDWQE